MKHALNTIRPRQKRGFWDRLWLALLWRYLSHSIMLLICVLGEGIPAPTLNDRILSMIPYFSTVARYNYHIWIICYIPLALALLWKDRRRFIEFLYAGGVLSLLRGASIFVTNLGPVNGKDINAGKPASQLIEGWLAMINPFSCESIDAAHIYLTKDLFFSGHTASTFLLLLYVWRFAKLRLLAIAGHTIVVTSVFMSHLHYTIDVIGGWAASFCVFSIFEYLFNKQAPQQALEIGSAPGDIPFADDHNRN